MTTTSTALRTLLAFLTLGQTLSFQFLPSIRKHSGTFSEKFAPLSAEFKTNENGHECVVELGDDSRH
jgi:hypothetical protein